MPPHVAETDPEAGFIGRLQPVLRAFLLRLCGGGAERADELLAETTARLWEKRDRLLPLPEVEQRKYSFTVARNLFLDSVRQRTREATGSGPELENLVSTEPDVDHRTIVDELALRAQEIVETLTTTQQEAIRLHFYEGLSSDEIAHHMAISSVNARVLLHRALKAVRARMGVS